MIVKVNHNLSHQNNVTCMTKNENSKLQCKSRKCNHVCRLIDALQPVPFHAYSADCSGLMTCSYYHLTDLQMLYCVQCMVSLRTTKLVLGHVLNFVCRTRS